MSSLLLNFGDTLRRDHVKLTPSRLAKILDATEQIILSYDPIKKLTPELIDAEWARVARKSWNRGMGWLEALAFVEHCYSKPVGDSNFTILGYL